jgi:polyphenol oxidase
LLLLRQVHGAQVWRAPWDGRPDGDAAVALSPGALIGIQTADCLPVLLADPRRRIVGAAHAGWRGTAAGVVTRLVAVLQREGSRPADLIAGLGPAIGPCCYEVGEDVRTALGPLAATAFRPGPRGRPHLDLRAANRQQLLAAGLCRENIHAIDVCTACRPDLYHSYRRDGSAAGRMISYIGFSG